MVAALPFPFQGSGGRRLRLITGKFVQPIDDTPLNTHVVSAGRGTVTLPATDESWQGGVYSLIWKDDSTGERRQGTLGPIVRADDDTVTRELAHDGPPPAADAEAKICVTVWAADPRRELGLDYRDVTYPARTAGGEAADQATSRERKIPRKTRAP